MWEGMYLRRKRKKQSQPNKQITYTLIDSQHRSHAKDKTETRDLPFSSPWEEV